MMNESKLIDVSEDDSKDLFIHLMNNHPSTIILRISWINWWADYILDNDSRGRW